jgi:hypothetical protein
VDVFHRDFLLALPAVAIERVEQHCEGASELAGLVQMLTPQGRRCIAIHGVFVAAHCGVVAGEHLRRNHLFEPVFWLDCGYTSIKNFSAGLVEVLDRLTGDSTRGLSADVSFPPNARFSVAAIFFKGGTCALFVIKTKILQTPSSHPPAAGLKLRQRL